MGLFDWLFKRREKVSPYAYLTEVDEHYYKFEQKIHDRAIEMAIKLNGLEAFQRWLSSPVFEIDGKKVRGMGLFLFKGLPAYNIYHEATAKFKDSNFQELMKEELNKHIYEYEKGFNHE